MAGESKMKRLFRKRGRGQPDNPRWDGDNRNIAYAPGWELGEDGIVRKVAEVTPKAPKWQEGRVDPEQVTFALGNPDDEILATILRGLLSRTDSWYLGKVHFPESGRMGWEFSINGSVMMDSKYKDAIENVFPHYTGKTGTLEGSESTDQ